MNKKTFSLFVLLWSLAIFTQPSHSESVRQEPSVKYKLTDHNSYVGFGESITYDKAEIHSIKLTFKNLRMGTSSDAPSSWYVSIKGPANITVTQLFDNKRFKATIDALSSLTSTTTIYVGDKGCPKQVTGATSWVYDPLTKTVMASIVHPPDSEVTLDWNLTPPPPPPEISEPPLNLLFLIAASMVTICFFLKVRRNRQATGTSLMH